MPDKIIQLLMKLAYRLHIAWCFVARPPGHGAYVAVWHDRRILLVQNSYRRPQTFPSGHINRGETPLQGAVRELREEVGISVAPERLRFVGVYTSRAEYKRDRIEMFELKLERPVEIRVDNREVVWAGFVPLQEALRRELVEPVREYLENLGNL